MSHCFLLLDHSVYDGRRYWAADCDFYGWQNRSRPKFSCYDCSIDPDRCPGDRMVNGNLGTGVAVMGAFSLVRFRSVPGKGKEITVIFLAWPSVWPPVPAFSGSRAITVGLLLSLLRFKSW